MQTYEEFQDQKRQREIENCFNVQVTNYKDTMTTSVDFNQDDFEKYYADLHKSTMTTATRELQKMKFKDEASKMKSKKALEDELGKVYATLRTSKTAEFNQHLNLVSMLVSTEFEKYKNDLNWNLNYESQTNFEGYINEKHLAAKKAAIASFENSKQLTFTPRKAQFKEELIAMIDTEYSAWRILANKEYVRKQNVEFKEILKLKVDLYKSSMNLNIDFNREDFLTYLSNRHEMERDKYTQQFIDETDFLNNIADQNKFKSQLAIDINKIYIPWYNLKKSEHETFVKNRKSEDDKLMSSSYDSILQEYKNNIDGFGSLKDSDYQSYIWTKHKRERENALEEFKSKTNGVNDRTSITTKVTQLRNAMDDYKDEKIKKYKSKLMTLKLINLIT